MSYPLRVLFVAGSLGGGGAERRLVEILQHLDRTQVQPSLYLSYRRGELLQDVPTDVPVQSYDHGPLPPSWWSRIAEKLRAPCLARAWHLQELLRRQPVDVVMSWGLLCSYEVALARPAAARVPYVVLEPQAALHDAFPVDWWWRQWRANWTYQTADLTVANSVALTAAVASQYQLPAARMATLPNLRDFERIQRLSLEPVQWPAEGPWFVALGRLHQQKGFDVLLTALAQLPGSAKLMILGQGPQESALREQARQLGIDDLVYFPGFVANPYPYLRSAQLFVLSSRYEGLPNVLLEALACETPVVATDCPTGPREILEDGRWGSLIPVEDSPALAREMLHLLNNPPTHEMRAAARETVLARYGLPQGLELLEACLRKAVEFRLGSPGITI